MPQYLSGAQTPIVTGAGTDVALVCLRLETPQRRLTEQSLLEPCRE